MATIIFACTEYSETQYCPRKLGWGIPHLKTEVFFKNHSFKITDFDGVP